MNLILNKAKKASDRYHLLSGSMGSYGDPENYPTHKYEIAIGVDRGNGYHCYMSVTNMLEEAFCPREAYDNLVSFLKCAGYGKYLSEIKLRN